MTQALYTLCGFDKDVQTLARIFTAAREPGDWFSSVELDALPPEVSCMAAAAAAAREYAGVPQALVPRLRGIVRYVHTLNSGMISGLCALGTALNGAGIPALLLEDSALYLSCTQGPQRHLWQMRLGVPRQDYRRALETAREAGWTVEEFPYASMARQGVTRQVSIAPVDEASWLWRNTSQLKKGSAAFLCPENAAILMGLSQSAFRNLTKPNPRPATVRWCMDMALLLPRFTEADWQRTAALAAKDHVRSHMHLLLLAYGAMCGSDLPQRTLFGTQREALRLLELLEALRACPETGHKARRVFLLCRLRRPDSLARSTLFFFREALRKLGI